MCEIMVGGVLMASVRDDVSKYIKKKYKASPEYLWKRYPSFAVYRHEDNRKWFALIATISRDKLGIESTDEVDVLNVKIDDLMLRDMLLKQQGFYPGYHMNKGSWMTILLDGTVNFDEICNMIDASFLDTASKKKKDKFRQPKEWIVPANPKYYDIEHAFDNADEIDWKQGAGIIKGDTVFMYVGAPVSAILYNGPSWRYQSGLCSGGERLPLLSGISNRVISVAWCLREIADGKRKHRFRNHYEYGSGYIPA